ncbi:hypothetical protein BHM03_00041554 [Ensete ventricosum]|nr:hypothetical protein BHM03_00041554 [Ensete ventricosum]
MFPNNSIRAKVFVRKIDFKLCVIRLNCVESFYAFLLRFRSEGSPCKGQPGMATANPLAGVAGHLQGAAGCSQGPHAKGRSDAASPRLGLLPARRPLAGAVASPRGATRMQSACHRGGCPRRQRAAPPPAKGSDGDSGVDRGKERARASF